MKKTEKDIYSDISTHALAGFQLLEASLKDYISDYYCIIKALIEGKLIFKHGRKDIENAALGRLCTIFSKLNNNEELIKKIQSIQKHRDDLAHRALALIYSRDTTKEKYLESTNEYQSVVDEIEECLRQILEERSKLRSLVN